MLTDSARRQGLLRPGAWFRNPNEVEEIQEFAKELQERLEYYWRATHLELWPSAENNMDLTFRIAWRPGSELSKEETGAFLDVLSLTRRGYIHKLRKCDTCPRWMFVKFPNGDRSEKQCSDECKKEARNFYMCEYQRKRRKKEKDEDERAKIAVGYRRR
jgi:hypothetical protein